MKENHSFSNLIIENKFKQAHEFYIYVQELQISSSQATKIFLTKLLESSSTIIIRTLAFPLLISSCEKGKSIDESNLTFKIKNRGKQLSPFACLYFSGPQDVTVEHWTCTVCCFLITVSLLMQIPGQSREESPLFPPSICSSLSSLWQPLGFRLISHQSQKAFFY